MQESRPKNTGIPVSKRRITETLRPIGGGSPLELQLHSAAADNIQMIRNKLTLAILNGLAVILHQSYL